MAQTKRKRQTKHRGNAAGVVESRGRTGRKPTAAEKSGKAKAATTSRASRIERLERPPSWRGAFYKAMVAAVLFLLVTVFVLKQGSQGEVLFPIVLVGYTPISYYTDLWLYRRRMRGKGAGSAAARAGQNGKGNAK